MWEMAQSCQVVDGMRSTGEYRRSVVESRE